MKKSFCSLVLFFSCILLCISFQEKLETYQIVNNYGKAVVLIVTANKDKKDVAQGSGFIINPKGIIITNNHVIKDAYYVIIKLLNEIIYDEISIIDIDERRDIAIIKIKGLNLPTIKLGNSDNIKIGEPVVVIGNPKGLENTVTDGLISGIRKINDGYYLHQISAPISSGSSGSPVFNMKGEVIGIATLSIVDGQNLNFSIPINYARTMIGDNAKSSPEEFPRKTATSIPNRNKIIGVSSLKEFLNKMDVIIRKVYLVYDNFIYGIFETLEPHSPVFQPDKYSISLPLFMASEVIDGAFEEIIKIDSNDIRAAEIINSYKTIIEKVKDGIEMSMQALKSYPNQTQFPDWNKVWEGITKVTAAYTIYVIPANIKIKKMVEKISPEMLNTMLPVIEMSDWNYDYPVFIGALWGESANGVYLLYVNKGSNAESANLKKGDTILGVYNGESFPSIREFHYFIMKRRPGDIKVLLISRGGVKQLAKIIF